ncbi:MAG: GatB/YqeY domain-containing protein [Verrucomicrobiota bacterium]
MSDTSLATRVMDDLKAAMKAKDSTALTVLRALKSAMKNAAIEKGGADYELNESEAMAVIRKQIKQRQDSADQFEKAGRAELAENENAEIKVLEDYLPAAMSEAEIDKLVEDTIAELGATSKADMGKVMKTLQEKAAGRADGKALSQAVGKRLS